MLALDFLKSYGFLEKLWISRKVTDFDDDLGMLIDIFEIIFKN